jgi:hypothetical protein
LVANNKNFMRDNLSKRKSLDDMSCLFCSEYESVSHLFFSCCVAGWVCLGNFVGDLESPVREGF